MYSLIPGDKNDTAPTSDEEEDAIFDALEAETDNLLFPDAIRSSPRDFVTKNDLPEMDTGKTDPLAKTPLCWCYAPMSPAIEMDVRVDVGFVDDIFVTDSHPFRYTFPLPRITSVDPPFGRTGTVVTLKFDQQRGLGAEGDGLLGFCRFGGRLLSPAKLFEEGFRCAVPEGLGVGEQMDIFLSLQFSDIDVELQAKMPLADEASREKYVKDNRGQFALTSYKIERDAREFFRVARNAFEVSEPMHCVVDMQNYDDHLRKGYIRIEGEAFQPLHQKTYRPELECVYTDARILEFCDGKLPEIHESWQASAECRDNYHTRRTARTTPIIQNRRLMHCPLPEDRQLQGDVLLQIAEKHRPNALVPCTTRDKFDPQNQAERVELPEFRPLNITIRYEARR